MTVIKRSRFDFWPVIVATVFTAAPSVSTRSVDALLIGLVIASLASYGFLLNDLWDRDVDRINDVGHFEQSNAVTLRWGVGTAIFLLLGGFSFAQPLGQTGLVVSVGLALALTAYTVVLRRLLLVPTLVAGALAAAPLWIPMILWSTQIPGRQRIFLAAIFVIVVARETLMDVRDRNGDQACGRDTVATVFGDHLATVLGIGVTVSGVLMLLVAVVLTTASSTMEIKVGSIGVALVIIYLVVRPASLILSDNSVSRTAMQLYVRSSRHAMALIPLLNILLWHT